MPKLWKDLMSIKPNVHTERVMLLIAVLDDSGSQEGIGFCRMVTPIWDECRDLNKTVAEMRAKMPHIPAWLEVDQSQVQWERVFVEYYLGERLLGDDDSGWEYWRMEGMI
ncbi:MAG: hypothetical protein N5P05_004577 [Chroococcopsis gigantea SAG 12.99]|jgi:hypothetical protein|nr:hypothetical protein [Chroococcopsis gigantea SAG 12.99]